MRGFFMSCRLNKEFRALKEAACVLQDAQDVQVTGSCTKSIRELLQEEVAEYKSTSFVKYMGYRGILFLENRSSESSVTLFHRLRASGVVFKYVHRLVPLEGIFRFDEKKILDVVNGLDETKTYKILYEERLCGPEMRPRVFELITSHVKLKVNLTSPHYIIAVQAFKTHIGVSVVAGETRNFSFACSESRAAQ